MIELLSDAALARYLAEAAGELLLDIRAQAADAGISELKAAGDAGSQRLLAELLAQHRPADAVLSEEAADNAARLDADRVWIIDPLDGTREFAEVDRNDWAVHVALWQRGALVAGSVALPAQGLVAGTDSPPVVPPRRPEAPIRIAVSRTRPPQQAQVAAQRLGAVLVPCGSAGAKAALVWLGEVDAYVHAGGQYEWDSAAPVVVARAAGLYASRVNGSPLRYNQPNPYLPDLLMCRPELAAQLLADQTG